MDIGTVGADRSDGYWLSKRAVSCGPPTRTDAGNRNLRLLPRKLSITRQLFTTRIRGARSHSYELTTCTFHVVDFARGTHPSRNVRRAGIQPGQAQCDRARVDFGHEPYERRWLSTTGSSAACGEKRKLGPFRSERNRRASSGVRTDRGGRSYRDVKI